MTDNNEMHHGPIRCHSCEERKVAEQAAAEKSEIVSNLSDAALALLTAAIAEIYAQARPPA